MSTIYSGAQTFLNTGKTKKETVEIFRIKHEQRVEMIADDTIGELAIALDMTDDEVRDIWIDVNV